MAQVEPNSRLRGCDWLRACNLYLYRYLLARASKMLHNAKRAGALQIASLFCLATACLCLCVVCTRPE
ncbi:hypothetical protein J3E69DRAFT_320811 [Trichoderma sp. SZMC 28015]